MDEQQAIRLLKAGNLAGLDTLAKLYYLPAVKTAYLIVHDRAEAEDIVQNAFLHAYDKIHQLTSERFGPWFFRSVINASIKAAQKQKRQISLSAATGEDIPTFEEILADQLPSPEAQAEMGELSQAVWQALEKLPAEQRAIVVMKYYLDLSEMEISATLKRPVTTIKWRLYAAREQLRKLLRGIG